MSETRGTDGASHDEVVEDLAIAARVRQRDAEDGGTRLTLAEAAEELGIDLDELDPEPSDDDDPKA